MMKHVIYMTRMCQGVEVSIEVYNVESFFSGEIYMVGLLFGVVINQSIYRNFDRMAAFRFHCYYVN